MKRPSMNRRTLGLGTVIAVLVSLFGWVAVRSGPLAPVPVTVATVESRAIAPALFGIGTVESRYTYRIGPTVAGRVARVDVQVGDSVRAGQQVGEMDPIDLDQRVAAQQAALDRARAGVAAGEAQVRDLAARLAFAETQARRYQQLLAARSVSEEVAETRRQERDVAEAGLSAARAGLDAARREQARAGAEHQAALRQRASLRLVAPSAGLVAARPADPGTTVVAGQAVIEVIDPAAIWIDVRFDQLRAGQLRGGLPARVELRSRTGEVLAGRVLRIEPLADAVTEEALAKVVFDTLPQPAPSMGELATVTVELPALAARPSVSNASVVRVDGRLGVWMVEAGGLRFAPVRLGASDLDGRMQVLEGLDGGERVVVHSQRALDARSRIQVVDRLPGLPS
ncbi:MAG: efflux RND transporter periplasmic adaptor subunit [Burkholderiales bacterium]|nr:efflux RND transporter periplasmic adaptor subunit [Burkholderiales bacterium]OJX05073.1 MAG: efflux transporter periplasmic adaptor subunit [Burkholderiales bacterium 70-64]